MKENIKDEIIRTNKLIYLYIMIEKAIIIDNRFRERDIERRGFYYKGSKYESLKKKSN